MNYQLDNWTDWLAVAEFQYNNKKHMAMGRTLFKLNFGRHPWKENLMVQIGIQKSWEQVAKAIEEAQKSMNVVATTYHNNK